MANLKQLLVNGVSRFIGKVYIDDSHITTINGVAVTENPKFTDTIYTLPLATNGTRGGVQIGFTQSGKNYPVQLDSEKMYVNVPWTDNNTTYTIATGDSNGQIKVTPSSGSAYNVNVKGLGSAAYVNTTLFPVISTYDLPAAKAVRIQYPTYVPVLISAQRANSGGRLILLGGGYGSEGTVRNDFQEVVSSNQGSFTWCLPSSSSISNSIEIMNVNTNDVATITVWSSAAATFTEIDALSDAAMNKVIITSANYTNYTVTKTGSGASGTWGISISGNATTVNNHTVNSNVPANAVFTDTWKALSTSQAGYVAQAPNDTAKFLRGDATWATVTKANVGLSEVENTKLSTWTGSSNITTVGTITTGTWNGTTIAVNKGGTGATSFTSGALLIGNGSNAIGTRTIKNMTAKGNLGWTDASTDIYIPTVNTLAYWDGRYIDGYSNLTYCVKGEFGDASIKGVDTSITTGSTSTNLPTSQAVATYVSNTYLKLSGGTMTGGITFVGNQSSAWNDKGILFTNGSRIGENTSGGLGIYAADILYLRPSSGTTANTNDGVEISSQGLYPTSNNSESLGLSTKKWANVYATYFNGALKGNADTATDAKYLITEGDNRSIATTPNDYANRIKFRGLKTNSYINSPSSDAYSYLIGLRGWADNSGGNAYEIAFNDSGIFVRKGGTTTWDSWSKLATVAANDDCVTLTTTQTITGAKTFTTGITYQEGTSSVGNAVVQYDDTLKALKFVFN